MYLTIDQTMQMFKQVFYFWYLLQKVHIASSRNIEMFQ